MQVSFLTKENTRILNNNKANARRHTDTDTGARTERLAKREPNESQYSVAFFLFFSFVVGVWKTVKFFLFLCLFLSWCGRVQRFVLGRERVVAGKCESVVVG